MDDVSATGPSKSMSWTTFYITNHRPIQWHGRSRFNCHCSRNHLEQVWTGQPTGWQCLWWQQTEEDLRMHILWFMVSVWPRFGHLWPEFYGCKMGFMELCRQWLRRRRGGRGTRSVQVLGIGVNGIFVAKDRQSETDGGIGVESPAKAGPRHGLTIDWWICRNWISQAHLVVLVVEQKQCTGKTAKRWVGGEGGWTDGRLKIE